MLASTALTSGEHGQQGGSHQHLDRKWQWSHLDIDVCPQKSDNLPPLSMERSAEIGNPGYCTIW